MKLTHATVWVHDQDEALAFYTEKVGFEVREDVTMAEMGNFRWLSVGYPGQSDVLLVLMKLMGPHEFDQDTADKLADLVAKGVVSPVFFETDDLQGLYETLKARGVEFQQEPTQMPYGIDCAFRDPSGNQIRVAQRS